MDTAWEEAEELAADEAVCHPHVAQCTHKDAGLN